MSPIEALKLALQREAKSVELYQKLANNHAEIRELVTLLLIEEQKHQKMIQQKMVELSR
jgi:rubrerythrin